MSTTQTKTIGVIMVPTKASKPIHQAESREEAEVFADEFNRLEKLRPTGHVAFVDVHGVFDSK